MMTLDTKALQRGPWGPGDGGRLLWRMAIVTFTFVGILIASFICLYMSHSTRGETWSEEATKAALRMAPIPAPPDGITWPFVLFPSLCFLVMLGVPHVWIAYRRNRYSEDVFWWVPPIIQRSYCWGLYGVLCGGTLFMMVMLAALLPWIAKKPLFPLIAAAVCVVVFWTIRYLADRHLRFLHNRLRSHSDACCWRCFYDITHIHPDSDACPECGFSVSESISRWQVCPKAFRPKWVTEGGGREKAATAQDAGEARG